jgi:acyl-CoA reductase-like NAD-dependent aldehyde dehydrogenase
MAERAALLESAADRLEPRARELASTLASESGKPIAQALSEVRGAVSLLRANARAGRQMAGEVLPTEGLEGTERDLAFTRREPLGVIAAILPFNFPVELYVEKCAAALVGGNAVVAKAPVEDPLTVAAFHDALIEAGVPGEVAPLIHGGADVGAALASTDGVDAVSLTGSTRAGIAVAQASAPALRILHLELGGNNPSLILQDADLDLVASELAYGRLLMNGQACSASKRILVHHALHDDLCERLSDAVRRQVTGPALEPSTTIGPLITEHAARRVRDQVARAVSEGAELIEGDLSADGAFCSPMVLAKVPRDSAVAHDEEIFGPVFSVIPVADAAEALEVANESSFGLMSSVFTADLRLAMALAERLQTGGVVINGTDNYRPPVIPFGGVKLSGSGREGAGYTLYELTREKTIILRRFRAPFEELF